MVWKEAPLKPLRGLAGLKKRSDYMILEEEFEKLRLTNHAQKDIIDILLFWGIDIR
jgi:hypothetical protein